jgi:putative SOS response-associated peptidase YedK
MCGRYALYGPVSRLRERFGVEPDHWIDRYNIAPTQMAPVIRACKDGGREVAEAKWGLLPGWVKDPSKVAHPINARAETVVTKPMFRTAFRRFRVLVPASGFYEWMDVVGGKAPYYIRIRGGEEPMGFGGLLERWDGSDGVVWSYCIIVTEPNELVAAIHNRMPVIIDPEDYDAWLDPGLTDPRIVSELMAPYPAARTEAYPVGKAVGNPRSQGPGLIEPV